jgi:hypothetical protein
VSALGTTTTKHNAAVATINWDTVATSATTALVVTLAVEYAAKPRLEARKERILDGLRTRRQLNAAVVTLAQAANFILIQIPSDAEPAVRERFKTERHRHYERMRQLVQDLFDDAGRHAGVYTWPVRDLVLGYLTCIEGVVLSPRTQHRQAEIIRGLAGPVAMVLDGPRWQAVARVRAVGELRRLITETEQPPTDAVSEPPSSD